MCLPTKMTSLLTCTVLCVPDLQFCSKLNGLKIRLQYHSGTYFAGPPYKLPGRVRRSYEAWKCNCDHTSDSHPGMQPAGRKQRNTAGRHTTRGNSFSNGADSMRDDVFSLGKRSSVEWRSHAGFTRCGEDPVWRIWPTRLYVCGECNTQGRIVPQ